MPSIANLTTLKLFVGLFAWIVRLPIALADSGTVQYDRDIRPILSSHCYRCHGPDKDTREANLRLDLRTGLFGSTENGQPIVVAKDSSASELFQRITSNDHSLRMPPPDGGKPLTDVQIDTIKKWIEQGAIWRGHWAYQPINKPPIPIVQSDLAVNPIDAFLMTQWKNAGISPVGRADMATLSRRISLDLTGLIPTDDVLESESSDVYTRRIDELLASPRFGERMAVHWLDLVRYADSCGYHSDVDQQVSPFRDYVIQAFNSNMPFDQFTREQLAGDLLPNATIDQRIASGFNRLSKATEEGGAQEGEYLAKAFADRVRTVSGTWLAATFGCAECHDHKYDPITARDFYRLGAFFADVKERGVYSGGTGHGPELTLPSAEQSRNLDQLAVQIKDAKERLSVAENSEADVKTRLEKEIKDLEQRKKEYENTIPRTLVTVSVAPREIRILPRGDWLNQSGEVVGPAFPELFNRPLSAERRLTRLDLADWLVDRSHPLTARVFVNRLWKLFFGAGLSRSLDDLGAQGESPSNPELLDWLATELIDSGWNVKELIRLIVGSQAYQLSSVPSDDLARLDPHNHMFARQSRWRLDAEFLRDNALLVSGLLVERIGGPSVKPYQPEGYWEFLNFPKRTWKASSGADQYRRGVYTHWQRTFLHPALLAFDAPSREECTAVRATSNTPKSALTLLNDPSYVESARMFSQRIVEQGGSTDQARIVWAWQTALGRAPDDLEMRAVTELLSSSRDYFRANSEAVTSIQSVGQSNRPPAESIEESSAWVAVARAILNLHEFTTRN